MVLLCVVATPHLGGPCKILSDAVLAPTGSVRVSLYNSRAPVLHSPFKSRLNIPLCGDLLQVEYEEMQQGGTKMQQQQQQHHRQQQQLPVYMEPTSMSSIM